MSAASQVFTIPELLEMILLSLPCGTTPEEIRTTRFIHRSRTTCRTWHGLIHDSMPLRRILYFPSARDKENSKVYGEPSSYLNARPNPWIPHLLLNQKSWGREYPYETASSFHLLKPETPIRKYWTFSLMLSRAQYERLPKPGAWRELLVSQPPFQRFWYTRSFYERVSGHYSVTHLDYDRHKPRAEQAFVGEREDGVTLGMIVDAITSLFERYPKAKFVTIESIRPNYDEPVEDRPRWRSYRPGCSAQKAHE